MIEKQKKYSIYKITNIENGKFYIGKTEKNPPEKRWATHISQLKDPKRCHYLHNSIKEHGVEKFIFEIIAECKNTEDLKQLEIDLIAYYDTTNRNVGYNLTKGGDGASGYKHTEATKQKMKEIKAQIDMTGENNPFYGKTHTEETKKLISELASERYVGENNPFYGKKHSEESLAKMRLIQSTLPRSSAFDNIDFLNEIILMRGNKFSYKEIAEKFNFHEDTIEKVLKGEGIYKEKLKILLPNYVPEKVEKPFRTQESVDNLKKLYNDGYTQKELGQMFNLGQATISRILISNRPRKIN